MSRPPNPLATPLPWDLVAAAYAREITPHFELYARDALRFTSGRRPRRPILDVACGPGTLTLLAAREGGQVTAIDFSVEMIARLRERLAEGGVENVRAVVGDGQALPLVAASFDAAFSMFGLMLFPDRGRALSEIRRVLVPGGRVAISSWPPLTEVPLLAAVFATLRDRMPGLPPGDPHPPLGTAVEMRAELEAAGFREVTAHNVAHAVEHSDVAAFAASLRRTLAPLVLMRTQVGEEAFRPIEEAIDARLTGIAGAGPVRVTMPAWIGVGTA
jgi:SAM-dependent methyltransferase